MGVDVQWWCVHVRLQWLGAECGWLIDMSLVPPLFPPPSWCRMRMGHQHVTCALCFSYLVTPLVPPLPSQLVSNAEGTTHGTLLERLDHCATAAGRRLLREWLLRPLTRVSDIRARQDAVAALCGEGGEAMVQARRVMGKVPGESRWGWVNGWMGDGESGWVMGKVPGESR